MSSFFSVIFTLSCPNKNQLFFTKKGLKGKTEVVS